MADTPKLANPLSPLSQITSVVWPEYTGFLCEVHEKADTEAFGFPLYPLDKDGNEDTSKERIFPGTVGGTPNKALLGKSAKPEYKMEPDPSNPGQFMPVEQKRKWKEYRDKKYQSVGCINWWGAKMNEASTKTDARKWILSYAGPNTRYFQDGFSYGTSKSHNEIYCQGGIVAVALGPVTGAAMVKIPKETLNNTPSLEGYTHFIVCVCIEEDKEVVYRNLCRKPVFKKDMTDAIYKVMQSKHNYDHTNRNDGWLKLCDITLDKEYKRAATPFFFSEDGTKAAAIRLRDFKFIADVADGVEVTEEIGSKITVTIASAVTSASFSNDKNDEPYAWTEIGDFVDLGTVSIGGGVTLDEKSFSVHGTMTGTQIVAVDYDKNTLIECKYRVDSTRGFTKDWVKENSGIDGPSGWAEAGGGMSGVYSPYRPYANACKPIPVVDDFLMLGMTYPNGPQNHQDQLFYSDTVFNTLEWRLGGKLQVAVIELGQIITNKETTTRAISETMASRMFVRHLDLRAPILFVHISEEHLLYASATPSTAEAIERESWCKDFSDPEATTYTHIASKTPAAAEGIGVPPFPPLGENRAANWTSVLGTWTETTHWEWKAKTYRGVPPDTNDDDSKGKINSKSKYNSYNFSLIANSWIGMKQLEDRIYQNKDMGVGVLPPTPDVEYLANMELYDLELDDGTLTLYTVQSGTLDAEKTMGGKRLYPLGII